METSLRCNSDSTNGELSSKEMSVDEKDMISAGEEAVMEEEIKQLKKEVGVLKKEPVPAKDAERDPRRQTIAYTLISLLDNSPLVESLLHLSEGSIVDYGTCCGAVLIEKRAGDMMQ